MEKIQLKNSDLHVSRLCFGGCPMGGYGWGDVSKQELIYAVDQAVDRGINFFDTADVYGLGEGEKILGEALGKKRSKAVIATKFGVRVENGNTFYDNSPNWIYQSVERSLNRLQTDYIDLYQVHYRDGQTPVNEVMGTLDQLKSKGMIRNYGFSNIHQSDIPELKSGCGKPVSFQNEYSLASRKNEKDMIALSQELNLTPLTWGSLGQGILSGKYNKHTKFGPDDRRSKDIYVNFHGEKLEHNLRIVEVLKQIASEVNKPVPAVAIRWILDYLPDSVVIAGIKNNKQLDSNAGASGWKLNDTHIRMLENISREVVHYE